jgi:MATE family multidrug resistance protein
VPEAGAPPHRPDAPPTLSQELRGYAQLAGPMVVSRVGVAALAFTDGVMLARSSAEALAVHGLSESLMGRVLEVSMVAATAGLALAAQARAGGGGGAQAARVGTVWHNGLALASGLGLAALLFSALGGPLMQALGQPAVLVSQATLVVGLIGLSAWPALLGLVCGGLLESIGRARTVVLAVVLANVANIALNQWLIFGGLGVPALGAVGAATSTLVVRVLMAAGLLAVLWQAGRPSMAHTPAAA